MRMLLAVAAALATLALSACGSDDASDDAGADRGSAGSAFPAQVTHKYGTTTVERAPKRVVVVGLREQDALLALDVVPVATTEWYCKHPGAIFPWATDELRGRPTPRTTLRYTDGIDVERVAAQRPDLIVGVYSGMTRKEYRSLSRIAPTVAQPPDEPDYGSSWQEETLMSGAAVGKPDEAKRLVERTERLIADTAAEHPEFKGQTGLMVSNFQGIFVYGPDDVRNRLMTELGFTYPRSLIESFPDRFGGELPGERVDELNADTLVWFTGPDATAAETRDANPGYSALRVSKQGRDVFIADDDRVYEATSFVSVLSMPFLMDELVPRLAAAADGDPSTSSAQQGS